MKRALLAAVLVIGLTGSLAACFRPPPESGYVKALRFHDAWVETTYQTICINSVCVPLANGQIDHPPQWCLLLVDDKDKHHEGEVCMDPITYSKYLPGQHYPDPR